VDESVFLGLGAAVAATGEIGPGRRAALVDVLVGFTRIAIQLGASFVTFMGTEPLRRATDGGQVREVILDATGLDLHVLSHEDEALLTLIGVMGGGRVAGETLVVDIGGGSSEFCVAGPASPVRAVGFQLGCNRLTAELVAHDPATRDEVAAMRALAAAALDDAPSAEPSDVVLVGGTASNLLNVTGGGPHDPVLTRARIEEAITNLADADTATSAERFGVNPARARMLPAGAAIALAIFDRYGVDRARVSEAGIREGAVLVVAHAGSDWRMRLPELAHGWTT
jgi:exopolyphosphatase/guanosine-5'-triphosphate,3'-diphosphate pyrophosphatase